MSSRNFSWTEKKLVLFWERIIIPLDGQFLVYPGVAGVDEGAGVVEVFLFYTGLHSMRGSQPVWKRSR